MGDTPFHTRLGNFIILIKIGNDISIQVTVYQFIYLFMLGQVALLRQEGYCPCMLVRSRKDLTFIQPDKFPVCFHCSEDYLHQHGFSRTAPHYIVGDDGKVKGAVLDVMKLGEPDDSGRRRPVKTGETITVECDEVLVAVGVDPNPLVPQSIEGLKEGWAHAIEVNEDGQSNISDIYAGGDIARGAATVVLAMGDGRRAANKMAEELLAK